MRITYRYEGEKSVNNARLFFKISRLCLVLCDMLSSISCSLIALCWLLVWCCECDCHERQISKKKQRKRKQSQRSDNRFKMKHYYRHLHHHRHHHHHHGIKCMYICRFMCVVHTYFGSWMKFQRFVVHERMFALDIEKFAASIAFDMEGLSRKELDKFFSPFGRRFCCCCYCLGLLWNIGIMIIPTERILVCLLLLLLAFDKASN